MMIDSGTLSMQAMEMDRLDMMKQSFIKYLSFQGWTP